jgi:RHS repeat-associated protein
VVITTAPAASNGGPAQVTADTYNAAGELATQTTGSGTGAAATATYCYDPNGDVTSVVAPDGNTSGTAPCETSSPWVISASSYPTQAAYQTTSSYDSSGEMVSTTSPATVAAPNGATTTTTYDPAGNKLTATDPDGVTATWTYTPLGQPATVSYSGSSAHSVSYSYDANGDTTGMTDATGTSSYSWDPFGELTSAANGAGQTVGYGYDPDGDVTGITYPLPATATWAATDTVAYGYDHADDLTSVTDFNNHQIAITNNADSLAVSETLGATGDTIGYTYDPADNPSAITLKNSSATLQSFTYSDAPAGNILSETDTPTSSKSPAVYTYDAKGRVVSMTPGTGSTLNYGFDASSNLTTLPTGAAGTYDHDSELTSSVLAGTTTSYAYNPDGELLNSKQGSTTITSAAWNGAGQLTSYDSPTADMTAATYDGNGLRASMTTASGTQDFTWDAAGVLLMDSANAYIYTTASAPAEQVSLTTGTITYLNADSLGSVRGVVNASGALAATTSYDAWGNPQTTGGLTADTPFGYAGAYTDPDGLLYLVNRYYSPATGQFLSVDPDVATTGEPYGYADGDPVDNTDPDGLCMRTTATDSCNYDPTTGKSTGMGKPDPPPPYQPSTAPCPPVWQGCPGYHTPSQKRTPPKARKVIRKAAAKRKTKATKPASTCTIADERFALDPGCRPATPGKSSSTPTWLKITGLALAAVGLTVANAVQLGADPVTDGAEVLDVGALGDETAEAIGDAGEDDPVTDCESFTAATKVLLATGAAIPIASLTSGDKVLATNVKTGKTTPQTVIAVMVERDTDRYDLTIRAGHRTAVIDTTRSHLFWVPVSRRWVRAAALKYGDHLRTPSGVAATVIGGRAPADAAGWMWDLSVPGGNDHDFYIDTVAAAVLVHNCPSEFHPIRNMVRRCLAPIFNAIMTFLPGGNNYPSYPPIPTGTYQEWRYQRDTEEPKNPEEGGEESGGGEDDECAS